MAFRLCTIKQSAGRTSQEDKQLKFASRLDKFAWSKPQLILNRSSFQMFNLRH